MYWQHDDDVVRPHCWPSGELCLSEQPYTYDDVAADLNAQLSDVANLLNQYETENNRLHLIEEPLPYWNSFQEKRLGKRFKLERISVQLAAERAVSECKLIYGYRAHNTEWYLADSQEHSYTLASHTSDGVDQLSYSIGVRIPIEQALYPNEFPKSWPQVCKLLERSSQFDEAISLLETERIRDPWIAVIFLFFDAPDVTYGFAVASEHDNGRARGGRFVKRPLKRTTILEFLSHPHHGPLWHCITEHINSDAIFRRLDCTQISKRHQARVLIVGCGSLGGIVAEELSRAGVRLITLVDNQTFDSENLCRHVLGMEYLRQSKATALKHHLERQMPLTQIQSHSQTVTQFLSRNASKPENFDLILALTGESGPVWTLDAWRLQSSKPIPMIVSWAESFGIAGHAALLCNGKTMHDIENQGVRKHNMAQWTPGTINHLRRIPGCSATFQPMGRTKLLQVTAITVELALNTIDGRNQPPTVLSRVEKIESFSKNGASSANHSIHDTIRTAEHSLSEVILERKLD